MATFDSLSGEKSTEADVNSKNWARKQAELTKQDTRKQKDTVQTYEQYLRAKSGESENSGSIPVWKVADLTQYIAEDVQTAMNTLKDGADIVSAYSGLIVTVAEILSKIASTNASVTETLVNALRDEVKDILDSLFAVGGVYYLYIPPSAKFAGGIDYFKREFLNSLEDTLDPRRPQMSDTTTTNALFLVAGGANISTVKPSFEAFSKFLNPPDSAGIVSYTNETSTPIPSPENFSLQTQFSPRLKSPTKQDELYTFATDHKSDETSILRRIEGWTSGVDKASTLLVNATWEMPENVEFNLAVVPKTVANFGYYRSLNYTERSFGVDAVEFILEDVVLTDWVMVRSPSGREINRIGSEDPAILLALNEQRDIEPNTNGLDANTKIFRGDIVPGFHYYQDDDIEAPDKSSIENTLNGIAVPIGPITKDFRRNKYYYKMLFAGVRRKYRVKYVGISNRRYEVYVSQSSLQETSPQEPYVDTPLRTVTLEDLGNISAEDILGNIKNLQGVSSGDIEPIFDTREDLISPITGGKSEWLTSAFSPTKVATNSTVVSPVAAPEPNWYSLELKELMPPLKNLTNEAKRFVDYLADSLIESVNAIVLMVEDLEATIKHYDAWITKIMDLLKALLFPPMGGIHVLQLETNNGIEGIKRGFNKSFSGAPRSATGEKDYPDDYIKYGNRLSIGGKLADIGGNSYKGLRSVNDSRREELQADGSYVVRGVSDSEASSNFSTHTTEIQQFLFGGTDDRRRRHNEPTDEDMRRLGIPMYDSQHAVAGMVFMFEKVAAYNAFIRLLQLDKFFNKELDKAKRGFIGLTALNQVKFPSLNNIHTLIPSRNERLKKRLANLGTIRNSDSDAVNEEADAAVSKREGDAIYDEKGNCFVVISESEPFEVTALPAVLTFSANSVEVTVVLDSKVGEISGSFSAKDIADKINASYLTAVRNFCISAGLSDEECQALIDSLENLSDYTSDGGFSLNTPPPTFGDRTRSLVIGASSFPLATDLVPGARFLGIDFEEELETSEELFGHSTGDLLVECEDFGVPTSDMYRSSPAIYDFASFVSDPYIQDFGPGRNKLQLKIDNLPVQLVDVTGDNGARPSDRAPRFSIGGAGGGALSFPIQVDGTGHKFRIEVAGQFERISGVGGLILERFNEILAADSNIGNFNSLGVRPGDTIVFRVNDEVEEYTYSIKLVEDSRLILENQIEIAPSSTVDTVFIERVTRGGLPSVLAGGDFSVEVTLPVPDDINAIAEYSDVDSLIQAMNSGFFDAGIDGVVELSDNGDSRILITLGDWGIGTDTRLSLLTAGYVGSSAVIVSGDITSYFPLVIDSAKTKFRFELFGGTVPGIKEITIPENTYATAGLFLATIQNSLDGQGLSDVKVTLGVGGELTFYINSLGPGSVPFAEHYSYSEKVGINLLSNVSMSESLEYANFVDGSSLPPSVVTDVINFPLDIGVGRGDRFFVTITPIVSGRVSTTVEVLIPPGNYVGIGDLREAVLSGLTDAGIVSGLTGYLRVDIDGSSLRFTLIPESGYVGSSASLAIFNGRSLSGVTLFGGSVTVFDMRDYNYSKVFEWLTTNSGVTPTPGFMDPAPLAFLASDYGATSGPTVYDGSWDIVVGVNDRFLMEIVTPITGGALNVAQTIVITVGNYLTFASLVVEIQIRVDLIFGAGVFLVADSGSGDQLVFTLVDSSLFGEFTEIRVSGVAGFEFVSMGSQTPGAMLGSAVGIGDVSFLELTGGGEKFAIGSDSLFAHLSLLDFYESTGVSDFNLLRVLETLAINAYGTYKIPYSISDITEAVNSHFLGVSGDYDTVFTNHLGSGRVRVSGQTRGIGGIIDITAVDLDDIAIDRESAEVAELVFGVAARDSDIVVLGIGRELSVKTTVLENEGFEYFILGEGDVYESFVENDALVVTLEGEESFEQISTLESL